MVVVSDFDQNSGPPPVAKAKSLGVPVYTVGVGPITAIDLAVDLQAPPLMKKAERSNVVVTLRQTGLEGEAVTVSVIARRLGGSAESLGSPETLKIGEKSVALKGATLRSTSRTPQKRRADSNSSPKYPRWPAKWSIRTTVPVAK